MVDHGSWHVYMLVDKNMVQGKVFVTDEGVAFKATADLRNDAISGIIGTWRTDSDMYDIVLPFAEIANAAIEVKLMIMKNLVITDQAGQRVVFRFGMLSPQKALDKINQLRA